MEFQFYMPTRVCVGQGCVRKNSSLLNGLGKQALVLTGGESAEKNGSLDDVLWALHQEGIQALRVKGIPPNPTIDSVREAVEQGRQAGVDCIVAAGGGSVIDAAKAVAVLMRNERSDAELIAEHDYTDVLPVTAVPTTAGTGSEVTPYAVFSDYREQTKKALVAGTLFPRLAFLDASYTLQLPYEHTVATVVDALSHAVEGRLAFRATPITNLLACESLRRIGKCLPALCRKEDLSFEQREDLLVASMLAGMVIAHSGTTVVHAMGYALTVAKGIDHGKANGVLMAAYLKYCARECPMEVHEIYRLLKVRNVEEFAAVMRTLCGGLSLTGEEMTAFAGKISEGAQAGNTIPVADFDAIIEIFRNSVQ